MTKPIRKVAVLGSGVMGGGIAAHLANAGVPVLLLDLKDFAAQSLEKLEIKRDLFAKLDALLTGDTIIASNTSGLRIADMVVGRSERFRQHFLITHFFNPPRYMKLLELVAGADTAPACKERVEAWGK